MAWLPPRVVGPLSECSVVVRVLGQVIGSRVDVFADDRRVGGGEAGSPDQWFPLEGGTRLEPGSRVTATFTFGPDVSPPSPDPVIVQSRPKRPNRARIRTPLFVGGECVWVEGLSPGTQVQVVDAASGAGVLGTGRADDGSVNVGLAKPIQRDQVLEVHPTTCDEEDLVTTAEPPDDPPRILPPPVVSAPLAECQTEVVLTEVLHGATATATRIARDGSVTTITDCVSFGGIRFLVDPPLTEGESLTARQELDDGATPGTESAPVVVGQRPPPPRIVGPLCAGDTAVRVTGLISGTGEYSARLEVLADGRSLGVAEAPAATFDVPVPPLTPGAKITVRYGQCNVFGRETEPVTVDPAAASIPVSDVVGPLFSCASTVRVVSTVPGATVTIWSDFLGAPIGQARSFADHVDVAVTPFLAEEDQISAVQTGCGLVSERSPTLPVQAAPAIAAPTVRAPVFSDAPAVTVDALPGALVEVYVDGQLRGTATSGAVSTTVALTGGLKPDQKVTARQTLCARSQPSAAVPVTVRPPAITLFHATSPIVQGTTTRMQWGTERATSVRIDPTLGAVAPSGTRDLAPPATTVYTLTASNQGGSVHQQLTVTVNPVLPPTPQPIEIRLEPQAPITEPGLAAAIPYVGQVLQLRNTRITAIENPPAPPAPIFFTGRGYTAQFLRASPPAPAGSVVTLLPGETTTPDQLREIYREPTPPVLVGIPFQITVFPVQPPSSGMPPFVVLLVHLAGSP